MVSGGTGWKQEALAHGHEGAAGAQGRWRRLCPLLPGRHSPRELKRVAVNCLGEPEARVEMRTPRLSPPRGLLLLFVTDSVPEAARVTKVLQRTAPPLGQENDQGGHISNRKDQAMAW